MIIHRVCFDTMYYVLFQCLCHPEVICPAPLLFLHVPDLFYCLFIFALLLEIQLKEGKGWISHYQIYFHQQYFLRLSQVIMCTVNATCRGLFRFHWFELEFRGGCSFCWYRWNCWPSLFISILFNNYLSMYMPWQWEVNNNIFILFSKFILYSHLRQHTKVTKTII